MARTPTGGDYSPSEPLDNAGSVSREGKPWFPGDGEHTGFGNTEADASNRRAWWGGGARIGWRMFTRRSLLKGLGALWLPAPAIIPITRLMPVKAWAGDVIVAWYDYGQEVLLKTGDALNLIQDHGNGILRGLIHSGPSTTWRYALLHADGRLSVTKDRPTDTTKGRACGISDQHSDQMGHDYGGDSGGGGSGGGNN